MVKHAKVIDGTTGRSSRIGVQTPEADEDEDEEERRARGLGRVLAVWRRLGF